MDLVRAASNPTLCGLLSFSESRPSSVLRLTRHWNRAKHRRGADSVSRPGESLLVRSGCGRVSIKNTDCGELSVDQAASWILSTQSCLPERRISCSDQRASARSRSIAITQPLSRRSNAFEPCSRRSISLPRSQLCRISLKFASLAKVRPVSSWRRQAPSAAGSSSLWVGQHEPAGQARDAVWHQEREDRWQEKRS